MNVLSVQGLCKHYPNFDLKNVSFDVRRGEIMGFIGRNGAGKTTTLKSILNFVHPDEGEMYFFGQRFSENELDIKRRIGFVTGGLDYYTKKKLRMITDVTRRFYPNWDEHAYQKYMQLFSLEDSKTPNQLSAGMRVKYALTLALSHRAELLILDEPTSGLDPISRDNILEVFLELVDEGVSILFSSHITSDLEKCADRITYIKAGRLLASEDMAGFVAKYSVLSLSHEQFTDTLQSKLIGCKRAKTGFTALVSVADAAALAIPSMPADLETIMVHMERE